MEVVRGRATWVKRLLGAMVVISVVSAATDVREYRDPLLVSDFQTAVTALQFLGLIGTAIAFIAWLYGAYERLSLIGAAPRFRRWWAIASWFVPIFNFIRPKQMLDDAWLAGHRPALSVPAYMQVWWGLWIVGSLLSNVVARSYWDADTADEYRTAAGLYLVSDLLDAVNAVLAIVVVESITSGLERSAAARRLALEGGDPKEDSIFRGSQP